MSKHLLIPDMQIAPDNLEINTPLLQAVGNQIVEEQPDVIVNIGDFADMPSLSSFDKKGSKKYEGKRYKEDISSVHTAMKILLSPLWKYNKERKKQKKKQYKPRMVMTLGNHEYRCLRAIEEDPVRLEGIISIDDLKYSKWFGWEVHDFLEPVPIEGIVYSHYFVNPSSLMGRPISGENMALKLKHLGHSFTMGHQQILQYGVLPRLGGTIHGLVIGSCYLHDEDYLGPQGNNHWRGLAIKDNVQNGEYDLRTYTTQRLLSEYL